MSKKKTGNLRGRPASIAGTSSHASQLVKIKRDEALSGIETVPELPVPSYLSLGAKKIWKRVMAQYREANLRVLVSLDQPTLEMYCEALADYYHFLAMKKKALKALKSLDPGDRGYASRDLDLHDAIAGMAKASSKAMPLAVVLGLTPEARARMAIRKSQNEKGEAGNWLASHLESKSEGKA